MLHLNDCLLRDATPEDCKALSPRLRAADVTELHLAKASAPETSLLKSLENSKKAISVLDNNNVVQMMFGVGWGFTPRVGLVWLLSSDWVLTNQQSIARFTKPLTKWLLLDHDVILNYVHDENEVSMRWLKWQGFIPLRRDPNYGRGAPFTQMALFKDEATRHIYVDRIWPKTHSLEDFINEK